MAHDYAIISDATCNLPKEFYEDDFAIIPMEVTTPKFGRDESGFRVNTKDHAYLLRLNSSPGDYNFYITAKGTETE